MSAKPKGLKKQLAHDLVQAISERMRADACDSIAKTDLPSEELTQFFLGLEPESDRAVAIVAYSYMDQRFNELLLASFCDDIDGGANSLFGPLKPLGTSYARVQLAAALYWIRPDTYKNLHYLRKIRNEFAHSATLRTLDESPVVDLLNAMVDLETPLLAVNPELLLTPTELDSRRLFLMRSALTCGYALGELASAPIAQRMGLDPHAPLHGGFKSLPASVQGVMGAAADVVIELGLRDPNLRDT